MTADLKEALALAAVEFLIWRRHHEEFRIWGRFYLGEDSDRGYLPEPTVEFFGRNLSISAICARAEILSGPIPLLLESIFDAIDEGVTGVGPENYSEAAKGLGGYIEEELELQKMHPLMQPCTAVIVQQQEHGRCAVERATLALPFKRRGKLFGLELEEWRGMLATIDHGR